MSDYTAIAAIGDTLLGILWNVMRADDQVNALIDNENRISLESPFDLRDNDSVRLSVYLYRVVEDPNTKNQFPVQGNGARQRKPPLTLDLFYLVTPMVGSPREQHIVLGKVMQVLYDHAILSDADLVDSLTEEVRIILNPVTLEETTRVWQALEMSYRLSVCYTLRVAIVDSTREQFIQPVVEKAPQYGEKA